ncbi:hypothetical protein R84981_000469 [Carnimonas sp. R-84981]|uniref:phosphotransferase n=1 Tax=Carnimonas bestiolae TaxID=3402172 RepID=UPI003EDC9DAB
MSDAALRRILPVWARGPEWQLSPIAGGLVNDNFVLSRGDQHYFVKRFGAGTAAFIDRRQSIAAQQQACQLGIAPAVIHFDAEQGVEISEFLTDYRTARSADFSDQRYLHAAVSAYRCLHQAPLLVTSKDVFSMTDEHFEHGRMLGARQPSWFDWMVEQYQRAREAFLASGLDLVACHNDPMPGNFLFKEDNTGAPCSLKLVDFEFASNNERAYELGVFLGEMFVDSARCNELMEAYFGAVTRRVEARVWVMRAIADVKWGAWAVQQRCRSDWDFDYQKYGMWKYARARELMLTPDWERWMARL